MEFQQIITRLKANAAVFQAQCRDVPEKQARWKPAPGKWSILEVMNHLADEETDDFRTRVDLTLHSPGKAWPAIDPPAWAVERKYNERDLAETVVRFVEERANSVTWLEQLEGPQWDLAYEHPVFGTITAGRVLTSWLAHDHIHIRQINRLQREYLVTEVSDYPADYAGDW